MEELKSGERFIINKIVCDETNNTEEDIKNGILNADVFATKLTPVNEITIEFIIPKNEERE